MPGDTQGFRFIDLFAGLGGFHLALEELGGGCVFAAEWEPTLNDLYTQNYGLQPWSDITTLDTDAIIDTQIPDHDVLAAGFPCQPFSKSGSQLGFEHTAQGRLFFAVLSILRVKKPRRFILENVPNILKHDDGATLTTIRSLLKTEGYDVDVEQYSPDQFGIPQVRHRAYFVGSRDGLGGFPWPERGAEPTSILSVISDHPEIVRSVPERTEYAIDMWGDFLRRSEGTRLSSSWPLWAMEFGATYPFVDETPAGIWQRRKVRGLSGLGLCGDFGIKLDGLTLQEQHDNLPSHSRRKGDVEFPRWKQTYIRQNREFYNENRAWIDPWMRKWQPWELPSSFQKFEWNAQGGDRDIDGYVLQIRASGVRVKRPHTAPSLIAMTQTQVPLLGSKLGGGIRRYMTVEECAKLQSLDGIALPESDIAAYRALGNAVNAKVVRAIAEPLVESLNTEQEQTPAA